METFRDNIHMWIRNQISIILSSSDCCGWLPVECVWKGLSSSYLLFFAGVCCQVYQFVGRRFIVLLSVSLRSTTGVRSCCGICQGVHSQESEDEKQSQQVLMWDGAATAEMSLEELHVFSLWLLGACKPLTNSVLLSFEEISMFCFIKLELHRRYF